MKREDLLHEILSQPSAPFRERHVMTVLERAFIQGRVPHFRDPIGNIVVGVGSRKEYAELLRAKTPEPVRMFIAHMDHPGFHGATWNREGQLEVTWHGGSPRTHIEGANVWLASAEGPCGTARVISAKMLTSGVAVESAVLEAPAAVKQAYPDARSLYGGFSFRAPWWQEGSLIYTKAADDLVGAFAIASLALDRFETRASRKGSPFLGLLTRAEEVGFIGAIGHLELGWLQAARRPVVAVSLETSRTLPGAEIGSGPVVRLGDKFTVFDSKSLRTFILCAERELPGTHQRRVMDGGTCEATTMTSYGIPSVGISVPLGNYHNQSFQGGPDSRGPDGPAPEFVHLGDVEGMIKLCHGLLKPKQGWADPFGPRRKDFKGWLTKYRPLLKSGP